MYWSACEACLHICVSIHIKYFQVKQPDAFFLPWQPSSLLSHHRCTNTPAHKICQRCYDRLRGGVFMNRDIQVKNCLFAKQLFFPLQRKKGKNVNLPTGYRRRKIDCLVSRSDGILPPGNRAHETQRWEQASAHEGQGRK